jgi:hypothetical protein
LEKCLLSLISPKLFLGIAVMLERSEAYQGGAALFYKLFRKIAVILNNVKDP